MTDSIAFRGFKHGELARRRAQNLAIFTVSPSEGFAIGGTSVTVFGIGFEAGSRVTFGGTDATGVLIVSEEVITCTAPAGNGVSDVLVIETDGRTTGTTGLGKFTFVPAPIISSVTPIFGLLAGGTYVSDLHGTFFRNGATVTIGGASATSVTFVSSEILTCTAPAGSGLANIVVTNSDTQDSGASGDSLFTFANPPVITGVTPLQGIAGQTSAITDLAGTDFINGATVTFGGVDATDVVFISSTQLTCTTPAGAGLTDIVVTNPDTQTSGATGSGLFLFAYAPAITSVTPASGFANGGTSITDLAGTDFVNGATVTFGGVAATSVTFVSATQLTCTTPAGIDVVDILVTNPDAQDSGATGDALFTYDPYVSLASPAFGTMLGGTVITISGEGFITGATVTIGGTSATSVVFNSDISLTCTTPAGSFATQNVVVTNPSTTTSGASGNSKFTYFSNIKFDTMTPGSYANAAFLTATGLDSFSRADVNNPYSVTVQITSSTLETTIPPNYGRIYDDGTNKGLLIEQAVRQYLGNGIAGDPRFISSWSGSGQGTQSVFAATGPDGTGNASRVILGSNSLISNYGDRGSETSTRYTFSQWARSKDATSDGDMEIIMGNIANTAHASARRNASNSWGRMTCSTNGVAMRYIYPVNSYDWSASGGEVAKHRDTYIDFMQIERGDFSTSCISVSGGSRERDVPRWAMPTANSRIRFYVRFRPLFSSSSTIVYGASGGGTDETTWNIYESLSNINYVSINSSDKKIKCRVNGGSVLTSTNAISFTAYDDVEMLIEVGNSVASTLKYRVNSGSWTDLVLATDAGDPTTSSPYALMTAAAVASVTFPCLLREVRSYPIEITTADI